MQNVNAACKSQPGSRPLASRCRAPDLQDSSSALRPLPTKFRATGSWTRQNNGNSTSQCIVLPIPHSGPDSNRSGWASLAPLPNPDRRRLGLAMVDGRRHRNKPAGRDPQDRSIGLGFDLGFRSAAPYQALGISSINKRFSWSANPHPRSSTL